MATCRKREEEEEAVGCLHARACREIGEPPPHTWAPPARAPHGELTPLREQRLKAGRGVSLPLVGVMQRG